MKLIFGLILSLGSLSSFARDKSGCDSLSGKTLAVSGAFQQVEQLDSLLEVDLKKLASCGAWDLIDQQIMNADYLKEIISASLKNNGEFPTYGDVFAIFDQVKASELYPAIRLSKTTFEALSGKTIDWDNLEYDQIKTILITDEEFGKFKDFLGHNKFTGELSYGSLLELFYEQYNDK